MWERGGLKMGRAEAVKGPRRVCIAPSCLVHFRWPGPRAASIIQRLIKLTFRPALSTSVLPVLCPPLTMTLVSHRQGRSENRLRESTQAEAVIVGWADMEGREAGVERAFGEGAEEPLFNFTLTFHIREKAESGVLCHPATQGPLKSSLSGFSSEVSCQETKKRGKEWVD